MAWWDTTIRVVNIAACAIALLLLARSAYIQRARWNDRTHIYWWALVGWVFLGLESTIELLVQDVDPGPRTIVLTLVLAWTLRALTLKEHVHAGPVIGRKKEDYETEEGENNE